MPSACIVILSGLSVLIQIELIQSCYRHCFHVRMPRYSQHFMLLGHTAQLLTTATIRCSSDCGSVASCEG